MTTALPTLCHQMAERFARGGRCTPPPRHPLRGILGSRGRAHRGRRLADALILAPSRYVPRIQEAHATAYHLLRELLEASS